MSEYIVIAVCHTNRQHKYITLWRPDDCGYTPVVRRAGRYSRDAVLAHVDYYHGGQHIAVPAHVVESLGIEPPARYFDYAGPAVPNTRASWEKLLSVVEWPTKYKIKPEWQMHRGPDGRFIRQSSAMGARKEGV
ncbi:hypothetical protein RA280_24550 [Cupriavidus sp. CV2]|uniref:hypothetical protein n=1 Tax=Cupriavidus ulmosensis TaxID=3065913 RepID=UPI00296B1B3D|nr:hypothetical protein [Cupriavidus sp. CV2]MDW3684864.1 hypothetical protein [Cupriavidus sp. CV2]